MTRDQEIYWNLKAVENAVAQQRLEGLEVPPEVVEDMKRAARGEIKTKDIVLNILSRVKHGKVREQRPLS